MFAKVVGKRWRGDHHAGAGIVKLAEQSIGDGFRNSGSRRDIFWEPRVKTGGEEAFDAQAIAACKANGAFRRDMEMIDRGAMESFPTDLLVASASLI